MKKPLLFFSVVFVFFSLLNCAGSPPLKEREKGAIIGSALGAGLGAIIGKKTGHLGEGIAIGAAAGAITGGATGNQYDVEFERLKERERLIQEQQRQIEQNRRLIEQLKRKGFDAYQSKRGVVVNLPDVLFEFDKYSLTPEAKQDVAFIANQLKKLSSRKISVEGHTDSIGTISYNQWLSEKRAESVANELVRNGISRRRISVRGFGESYPIASNSTEEGRARNRRVEVIIENQ